MQSQSETNSVALWLNCASLIPTHWLRSDSKRAHVCIATISQLLPQTNSEGLPVSWGPDELLDTTARYVTKGALAHTRMHARIHAHSRTHAHTPLNAHAHTHIYARMRTDTHMRARTHTHTHKRKHTHMHTHTQIRTHTHTCMHTRTRARAQRERECGRSEDQWIIGWTGRKLHSMSALILLFSSSTFFFFCCYTKVLWAPVVLYLCV